LGFRTLASMPHQTSTCPRLVHMLLLPAQNGNAMGENLKCVILVQMFREAKRPPWWPLEKWSKDQLDRAPSALVKVYTVAQKQWLAMQKAHALP
jgi:hypothetical protein